MTGMTWIPCFSSAGCISTASRPCRQARASLTWMRLLPCSPRVSCLAVDLDQLPSPLLPVLAQEGTPTLGLLMHGLSTADLRLVSTLADMWSRVLAATPADHPARAEWLSNLGAALQERFRRTGAATDLDEAIEARRAALTAFADTEDARAEWLSNLGTDSQDLFRQADAAADLDEAIEARRAALAPFADTDLDQAALLSNLGNALYARYRQSAGEADLDEAIQVTREAAAAAPDHPGRSAILANLAKVLVSQYERTVCSPTSMKLSGSARKPRWQPLTVIPAGPPYWPTWRTHCCPGSSRRMCLPTSMRPSGSARKRRAARRILR